ncbi:NAD(P)/FAD-dependent oxidoreductase [Tersicoccus solisilvae]|uniref:NAD(P)/FAD-dependent oxidoreductase n=1 Tax=Tersicoccus solisilvae TaxID=1882339 RepID=UPI00166660D0|nr:NAD(P)/FAD-dependent oxidoreductase [Tersicoccus solisilvae]
MAPTPQVVNRPRILIVGGGYVGLYAALGLQKKIKEQGGIVTLVDPLPYMTYQPFLPEVAAGNIESRHAVVSHRRHLKDTELINGKVIAVDHDARTATIQSVDNEDPFQISYDEIVIAAGSITRTFPIPGLDEAAVGLKAIEEANGIRNQTLELIETASLTADEDVKRRSLTFVVVGGGFAGIEILAELEDMARVAAERNPRLKPSDLRFVLVEAMGRIMPEVTEEQAVKVVEHLRSRGIEVHLNTSLASAEGGHLKLISMPDKAPKDEFDADTLIWTAGVQANPMAKNTGFPLDDRGRVRVSADLRITGDDGPIPGAWAAGDVAAVPDLSGEGPGGFCVPNAQHALRQAKRLAKNLLAARAGQPLVDYKHASLGAVAGFGTWKGVAKIVLGGKTIKMDGPFAWLAHRGYHGMAMPTVERKARVIGNWAISLAVGRDTTQLLNLNDPTRTFREATSPTPKMASPSTVPVGTDPSRERKGIDSRRRVMPLTPGPRETTPEQTPTTR